MDICIIEPCGGHKHMECIGFLLDIFKGLNVRVYYNNDRYDWIKYFKQLYNFDTENISNIIRDLDEINNCKKVINLTADKFFPLFTKINNVNKYEIHHLKHSRNKINTVIRLVKNKETYSKKKYKQKFHCYSIFEGNSTEFVKYEEKNIVMWIGWCKNIFNGIYEKEFKDWNDKMKYKLQFFWTGGGRDNALKQLKNKVGNDNVHRGIKSPYLPHLLKNVKFIMIRPMCGKCYGEQLWSGSITLALSHNIPIIIKKSYRDVVDVPGITYEENYYEVYDKINNMSDEDYKKEIDKIKKFKLEIREKERKELL
jgi:hypothetical protein